MKLSREEVSVLLAILGVKNKYEVEAIMKKSSSLLEEDRSLQTDSFKLYKKLEKKYKKTIKKQEENKSNCICNKYK